MRFYLSIYWMKRSLVLALTVKMRKLNDCFFHFHSNQNFNSQSLDDDDDKILIEFPL